jgi:hypothetical protein
MGLEVLHLVAGGGGQEVGAVALQRGAGGLRGGDEAGGRQLPSVALPESVVSTAKVSPP